MNHRARSQREDSGRYGPGDLTVPVQTESGVRQRRQLEVGIVGLGRWGWNYAQVLARIPSCRVEAMADTNPAALSPNSEIRSCRQSRQVRLYTGLEPLLEDRLVGAIVIATPDYTHFDLASRCLEAGLDVLVEKPMCHTVSQARRLVALAAARGRILAVSHTALYQPQFTVLVSALTQGSLGRPLRVESVRTSTGPAERERADVLFDLGPHDIAMVVSLFGLPVASRALDSGPNCAEFELLFVDEVRARCRVAWQRQRIRRFALTGTLGTHTIVEQQSPAPADQPLFRQCCDFVTCCLMRTAPQSNDRLGLNVIRCLESVACSRREAGRWVSLDELPAAHEAYAGMQ
ncbi:MAG: Gfo/Idh/MocA family oxidoreductase [candidate division WOR-3 bacterium]